MRACVSECVCVCVCRAGTGGEFPLWVFLCRRRKSPYFVMGT